MLMWEREFMNFTFESPQTNDVTNGIPAGFKGWIRGELGQMY